MQTEEVRWLGLHLCHLQSCTYTYEQKLVSDSLILADYSTAAQNTGKANILDVCHKQVV